MAAPQASSRLEMLQARFQQRQLLEKEQKLLQLYDQQQLRAQQVAQRGSAGSNGSNSSGHGTNTSSHHHQTVTRTSTQSTSNTQGGGKVRQMFDERRQTTVKGIDKSYPLEPLDNRRKQQTSTSTSSNIIVSSTSPLKNGNPMSNRQTVMTKRTIRSEANSNINGGKPVVSYHEEISRESGPTNRGIEPEEFGDDTDQISRYANGNPQIDRRNEFRIEDVTNDNVNQRHRTTAKIHLAGFDSSNETNRNDEDLENERFPEDHMIDVPDRLPRRAPATKKPSQAEARLERFKNSNTKKIGKTSKQVTGNTTSFTKKRTETTSTHSGSSSRASTMTRTMEEETSRASSTSPDLVHTGRPRSSSPEVIERERKLTRPIVDRTSSSSVVKNSCISKVSQMSHKNSMDFYPRRKSEFEKSKTFRKLQLELGESSPEPAEPDEDVVPYAKQQCRKRSSILDQNIYSFGRRSSSSSPTTDRDHVERKNSREKTPEVSKSRRGSESPIYHKKSVTSDDSKMINSTIRKTSVSNSATDFLKERRTSREMFLERPQSRRGSVSPFNGRKASLTRDHIERINDDSNIYLSRRRSSVSPIADREALKNRPSSHESSPERPASRRTSQSPVYHRKSSTVTNEETRTTSGGKITRKETTVTRKESTIGNQSQLSERQRSQSPREDFRRRSIDREESRATNEGSRMTTSGGKITRKETTVTRKESTIGNQSPLSERQRSQSPREDFRRRSIDREESRATNEGSRMTTSGGKITRKETTVTRKESTIGNQSPLSERQRSQSPREDFRRRSIDREESKATNEGSRMTTSGGKITRKETTVTRKESKIGNQSPLSERQRSQSPREDFRRRSIDREESKATNEGSRMTTSGGKITRKETTVTRKESTIGNQSPLSERQRSQSPREDFRRRSIDREELRATNEGSRMTTSGGKITRKETTVTRKEEKSSLSERQRSQSPREDFRRRSIDREESRATNEGSRMTIGNQSPLCERQRSQSPQEDYRRRSIDREGSRATNESRRSSEGTLRSVELVKKLVNPKNQNRSSERRTTLEDVEFPVNLVKPTDSTKRNKSPMHRIVKKEKAVMEPSREKSRDTSRKNSRETIERAVRSKSRTISPSPPSRRTMKETASFRAKKTERRNSPEVKKINEINKMNLTNERSEKSEKISKQRSQSPDEDKKSSRRSSAEITVRRHDTFKVNKPSQRTIEIESSVDKEEQSSDANDKSQLLERIEKIRTTLSRSGRSEQNLQSKDFERTDSVESALRRFDSIGVETEHQVTVGIDEPDRFSVNLITSKETSENDKIGKKSATSKPAVITVGIVKAQPRIDAKVRIAPKDKKTDVKKIVKIEKERSVRGTTPRKDENKKAPTRSSQKKIRSFVKRSNFRGDEPSGRGEEKPIDRSPLCKRKLFKDSDSEIDIDNDNSKSTVVLSTIIKVAKSPELPIESCIESKNEFEQPTKVLRSIEDIRKSIERESQDFKRELKKFNTAMKRDVEESKSVCSDGTIERVKITKIMKTGNEAPVVKIEKSTVKLPITHRVAKSPSPDIGTKRTNEGRARTPTASIRRSVPSSPAKSPDATTRYRSAELKSQGPKAPSRPSTSPSSIREEKNRWENSGITENEYSDSTDGPGNYFQSTVTESVSVSTKNDEFAGELEDDELSGIKDNSFAKSPLRKQSSERSLTSQRQQRSPTSTPLPRPNSSLSTTSSAGSTRGQTSNNKIKMSTKTKTTSNTPKGTSGSARGSNAAAVNDGLSPCKICGRRFNSDRITLHEQICSKTATKKRKQFDATSHRVKGTELEPFVKKGASKKPQAERKNQKPEVKSNWRRKHEDFINAIRSAKQVQAHLAAGGKLSDLPPPPASDTSDYVQCPHCGRKFNQGAAERHIPKCQNMMHNKPNPRAPPKPKR